MDAIMVTKITFVDDCDKNVKGYFELSYNKGNLDISVLDKDGNLISGDSLENYNFENVLRNFINFVKRSESLVRC